MKSTADQPLAATCIEEEVALCVVAALVTTGVQALDT